MMDVDVVDGQGQLLDNGRWTMDGQNAGRGSDLSVFGNFHVSLFACIHIAIMFYAIGLGLADEKDVSVKGLEIIKRAERVYLEAYTAVLLVEKEVLVRKL